MEANPRAYADNAYWTIGDPIPDEGHCGWAHPVHE